MAHLKLNGDHNEKYFTCAESMIRCVISAVRNARV